MIRRIVALILILLLFALPSLAQNESCNPDKDVEGYLEIATDYFYERAYSEAENALDCALALNPNEPETYHRLAIVHLYLLDIDSALIDAQWLVSLTENDPQQNIKALLLQVNMTVYAGDDDSALEILQSILDDTLDDAHEISADVVSNVYLNLGEIYIYRTQLEQAFEYINQSILYNDENALAYFFRGVIHAQFENQEQSQLDYAAAYELAPNLADYFRNEGTIYRRLSRYELAEQYYTFAIQSRENEDWSDYVERGLSYLELEEFPEAITDFTYSLTLAPNQLAVLFLRGRAYYELGEYEKAIADFGDYLEFYPLHSETFLHRGNAYYALGDFDGAIEDYKVYVELAEIYEEKLDPIAIERIQELENQ